jgi:hypothetical protein
MRASQTDMADVLNQAGCSVRQLPVDEWPRLEGLAFAQNGLPDPRLAAILVAETPEGEIVGVWSAMTAVHLEGLWVAPSHRRASWVAMKLLKGMKELLVRLGVRQSFTIVESTEVLLLATKAGFTRIRGDLCLLDLSREIPEG